MQFTWTNNNIKRLGRLIKKHSVEEVAEKMGTTVTVVIGACSRFKISRAKQRQPYTDKDDDFIRKWAGIRPRDWIAKKLNRSVNSVTNRASTVLHVFLRLHK